VSRTPCLLWHALLSKQAHARVNRLPCSSETKRRFALPAEGGGLDPHTAGCRARRLPSELHPRWIHLPVARFSVLGRDVAVARRDSLVPALHLTAWQQRCRIVGKPRGLETKGRRDGRLLGCRASGEASCPPPRACGCVYDLTRESGDERYGDISCCSAAELPSGWARRAGFEPATCRLCSPHGIHRRTAQRRELAKFALFRK